MKLQGIVCCAICFALPLLAQPSSSNSKTQNNQPAMQSASAQRSRLAVRTLTLTQQARRALVNHNNAIAKQDVNQALSLLDKIQNSKANDKTSKQADPLVPIYAEFEQTSFLQPVLTAQHKTGKSSEPNNSEMAQKSNSPMPQSDRPEAVTAVDEGYTMIALDTDAARRDLQQAQADLNKNDAGDADLKLAAVQQSVALASTDENRPLVKARENLGLADSAVQAKNYSEANAALQAAATALDGYSANQSAKHASDAKNLSKQLRSTATQLMSDPAASKNNVESWWNEVKDWTESAS